MPTVRRRHAHRPSSAPLPAAVVASLPAGDGPCIVCAGGQHDPSAACDPVPTPAPTSPPSKTATLTVAPATPRSRRTSSTTTPTNGKGFESAVAYAVADQMGFTEDNVNWTFAGFHQLFAPGEKNFDFALNQIGITPKREQAVTFSDPYYEAANGVLVMKDSQFADATTLAELQDAKIGVQIGTTASDQVEN